MTAVKSGVDFAVARACRKREASFAADIPDDPYPNLWSSDVLCRQRNN